MSKLECIQLETRDDIHRVRFVDDRITDTDRIEAMGKELLGLLQDHSPTRILIDFQGVRIFSSNALNKMIVLDKRTKAQKGRVVMYGMNDAVRNVFSMTQLDKVFTVRDSERDAIQAFAEQG